MVSTLRVLLAAPVALGLRSGRIPGWREHVVGATLLMAARQWSENRQGAGHFPGDWLLPGRLLI